MGSLIGVVAFKWHSEVASGDKKHFKNDPEHIMVTTPESLVLLMNGSLKICYLFSFMRFIILQVMIEGFNLCR